MGVVAALVAEIAFGINSSKTMIACIHDGILKQVSQINSVSNVLLPQKTIHPISTF